MVSNVPSEAVSPKIGPALWNVDSTGFVRMSTKDAFSWQFSQFLAKANVFGARILLILSNSVKLAQAQKPQREYWRLATFDFCIVTLRGLISPPLHFFTYSTGFCSRVVNKSNSVDEYRVIFFNFYTKSAFWTDWSCQTGWTKKGMHVWVHAEMLVFLPRKGSLCLVFPSLFGPNLCTKVISSLSSGSSL